MRGALGPYLNVFLVTEQHWSQAAVGVVTMIGGILALAVQTPIGALIDATRAKRAMIVAALELVAAGAAVTHAWPAFWPNRVTHLRNDLEIRSFRWVMSSMPG
ncbi:MAG TPA: hypothetical protein VE690_12120 [Rhodopila sp.]|nr:hypothetical protein [Rhodopila sp.]